MDPAEVLDAFIQPGEGELHAQSRDSALVQVASSLAISFNIFQKMSV